MVPNKIVEELLSDGITKLDLNQYILQADAILEKGCNEYQKNLHYIFSSTEKKFHESKFFIELNNNDIRPRDSFDWTFGSAKKELLRIVKKPRNNILSITLLTNKSKINIPKDSLSQAIGNVVKEAIFSSLFPGPFIASAERTGAAIFRKDLNIPKNRLLDKISRDLPLDPYSIQKDSLAGYAIPILANLDFLRNLENCSKQESYIAKEHNYLLIEFKSIIGGDYSVTDNDELYFIPKSKMKNNFNLSMVESSSSVRSLLDIGFYFRHVAQKGDLLMVDEPELNLHPENQRRVARLFARLVNLGIKVFITTHSDYFIKELNTLIMLNHDKPHLKKIMKEEGYKQEELISSGQVRVYIAEENLCSIEGNKKRTRCNTLVPANIDPELGIEARSFDITIDDMNRIQEEIIWGGE